MHLSWFDLRLRRAFTLYFLLKDICIKEDVYFSFGMTPKFKNLLGMQERGTDFQETGTFYSEILLGWLVSLVWYRKALQTVYFNFESALEACKPAIISKTDALSVLQSPKAFLLHSTLSKTSTSTKRPLVKDCPNERSIITPNLTKRNTNCIYSSKYDVPRIIMVKHKALKCRTSLQFLNSFFSPAALIECSFFSYSSCWDNLFHPHIRHSKAGDMCFHPHLKPWKHAYHDLKRDKKLRPRLRHNCRAMHFTGLNAQPNQLITITFK